MKPCLLVAGTGMMARDIGLYFLVRGRNVAWVSTDPGRLAETARRIRIVVQRYRKHRPDVNFEAPAGFYLYGDADIPPAEIVIECARETLPDKQEVFERLEHVVLPRVLLASNSSSILPSDLHPSCIGIHFFGPIEATRLAEMIFPSNCPHSTRERASRLLEDNHISAIEQTGQAAFAVNRLLLGLQAECFRMLKLGCPPAVVNEASASCLLAGGQLRFIDMVGLDVIHPAVVNYLRRMASQQARDYLPLADGLAELLEQGKRGRKNKDGLMQGTPLPWRAQADVFADTGGLRKTLLYILINSCFRFMESGCLERANVELVLDRVFGAESSLEAVVQRERCEIMACWLKRLYHETGLSYLRPAARLNS